MSKFDIATSMNGIMNSPEYKAVFAKPQPQLTKTAAKKKTCKDCDCDPCKCKGKGKKDKKEDKKDKNDAKGKKKKAMNKYQAYVIGLAKISESLDKESSPAFNKTASLVFAALEELVTNAMPTGEYGSEGSSDCGYASDKKDDDKKDKKDDKDEDEKKDKKENPFAKKDDDEDDEDEKEDKEDKDDASDVAFVDDVGKDKCLPGDPMCDLDGEPLNAADGGDEDDASDWYNKLMEKVIDPSHPEHDAVTETLGGDGPEDPEFSEEDIEALLSGLDDEEDDGTPEEFSFVSLMNPDDARSKMDDEGLGEIEYKSLAGKKLTSLQKLAFELKKSKRPLA